MIDVTMPSLGESVTEGTITKILVREGDVVVKDQPLLEVATDKADSELPSPAGGRVAKVLVREGETVGVKALLLQIEEGVTAGAAPGAPHPAAGAPSAPRAAASRSATGQALASPAARKTALEHAIDLADVRGSGEHGRITKEDVMRAKNDGGPFLGNVPPRTEPPMAPGARAQAEILAAAAASRPAQITQMPSPPSASQAAPGGGGFVPPIPGVGFGAFKVPHYRPSEGDEVVPFTRRRRITADHMTYSKFASPHVVTVAEVDLHKCSRLRELHKDRYKKEGLGLTMLAFVVVATARALREHKQLNARVLEDSFVIFKDVNVGVAVDSPEGLVVPVIRRADELGVRGIARAIDELAKRAKTGKITADDLSGATFSITNPGLKGNLFGGAIINQPNVGILRMGEIQKRVVVIEGPEGEDQIVIHPVMYMALSYDHRIVDGVLANSFLWRVTELLEKGDFEV
jgi:2-oxoglutarate dehydrogenase E2 component (dihydrolipoamide succinyltransferase)